MAREVTIRTKFVWESGAALAIGAGLVLLAENTLSGEASLWDGFKLVAGCGLLLYVTSTWTEVVLSEAGIRISSGYRILRRWVRRKEIPLLPWQAVSAVVAVTPRWFPLKMVAIAVGGRLVFLGAYWTSFREGLAFVDRHVDEDRTDQVVKDLVARYRAQPTTYT